MFRADEPEAWRFVRVIVAAAVLVPTVVVAKVKDVGETVSGCTPVPDSATRCVLETLPLLSWMVIAPASLPMTVGVKVTVTVQNARGAKGAGKLPQLLVCA